jgi:hypothetical protein
MWKLGLPALGPPYGVFPHILSNHLSQTMFLNIGKRIY